MIKKHTRPVMPVIREERGESGAGNYEEEAPSPDPPSSGELFVFIVLDKLYYLAGERVSGEILINAPSYVQPCELFFKSSGLEYIKVYEIPGQHRFEDSHNIVFQLHNKILSWEEGLEPGQYVYPFTYKLPLYCPSTFSFEGNGTVGEYIVANIQYKIKIQLKSTRDEVFCKHEQALNIRSRDAHVRIAQFKETLEPVKNWCLSKGTTGLKLEIAVRDAPTVNSTFLYKLHPDNSLWKAPIDHVISSVGVDMVFCMQNLKQYRVYKELYKCSRATWISEQTNLIYEKDFEYIGSTKFDNPAINPATNNTRYIKWEYKVELFINYQLGCGGRVNSIFNTIHVNPEYSKDKSEPELPANWEPKEHAIINLIVESATQRVSYPVKDSSMIDTTSPIN